MKNQKHKTSALEMEVLNIVENCLKETQTNIAKKDLEEIVQHLMPDLDKMIAKQVQKHFVEMGEFLLKKFKTEE